MSSSAARRILTVDDSAEVRAFIRAILEGASYRVGTASSGVAAIELLDGSTFDLILMDVDMPGLDGIATTEQIRATEAEAGRARTPIIGLSAHNEPGYREKGLQAGMDDFISKPMRARALLTLVERWTGGPSLAAAPVFVIPESLAIEFFVEREKDVNEARRQLENGRFDSIAALGHQLKGSAPTLGFTEIGTAGARLEAAANSGDPREIRESLDRLVHALRGARSAGSGNPAPDLPA